MELTKRSCSKSNVNNSRIVAFPEEYSLSTLLRPDLLKVESVPIQKLQRLTPLTYDRNIFHLELDLRNTTFLKDYKMGDALAVYPKNKIESVEAFIREVILSSDEKNSKDAMNRVKQQIVELSSCLVATESNSIPDSDDHKPNVGLFPTSRAVVEKGPVCLTTIERLLTTILDIDGNPPKDFLKQLSVHAKDILEKVRLCELTLDRFENEFTEIVVNGAATYTSILKSFPTARPSIDVLMNLIPVIKPRLYSIASSSLYQPNQLDLLIVEETWIPQPTTIKQLNPTYNQTIKYLDDQIYFNDSKESIRSGLCSHYLSILKKGETLMASITVSTMYLPTSQSVPIVMAGLGTGMAPFRAFLQEKKYWKKAGINVGPLALYFGSRHKAMEFLYGDELEEMESEGLLTRLNCAFSRDQPEKIYIQNRIKEDGQWLTHLLLKDKGHFYLCGPTWPVEDVKEALINSFLRFGGVENREDAEEILRNMKETERYVLEVY